MAEHDRSPVVLHTVETLYAVGLLVWLALPLFGLRVGLFTAWELPGDLAPAIPGGPPFSVFVVVLVAILPPLCLWKILSLLLGGVLPAVCHPARPFPVVLNAVLTADVLLLMFLHLLRHAASLRYFAGVPLAQDGLAFASLLWNAASLILLLVIVNRRDESYREYLEFRRSSEGGRRPLASALTRQGIQRRLGLIFIPLIALVIAVLSWVLLSDYRGTVLTSIIDAGRALAERTASAAKASADDLIAVDDYLLFEARKNETARFPFAAVSLVWRQSRDGAWSVAASTDRSQIGTAPPAGELLPEGTTYRYDAARRQWQFLAPVTLSGKSLGWVAVAYDRDVVDEPLFRTGVKVVLIAALFIYASAFLTYLFGRAIVFPILFLRMSVNGIASALGSMIKGTSRVSADLLQYRPRVRTRDEIRSLSDEIGNMTAIIRGVIPYISASTLKHAERETPTTEARNLAFLFTDIRGFTTYCEGKSPREVVAMLNHYLDIQSSVILAHGGDIDKFVGDAVMAMFEGPKKELNACRASLGIRTTMAEEQAKAKGQEVISLGIGINSGPVVFGSVGAKDRMAFTSIGDTVNVAARLEGANKTYGTKTLITEAVFDKVAGGFLCREIDLLTVKGKWQPVRIYELLQQKEKASAKLAEIVRVFEAGLAAYRSRKWPMAEKAFTYLAQKYRDEPSAVFLRRITLFESSPPPRDWDGVFSLTVK